MGAWLGFLKELRLVMTTGGHFIFYSRVETTVVLPRDNMRRLEVAVSEP
jgi:hypothetical protein